MCVTWYDFHFMITWLLEDRRSKILNMKSRCKAVIRVRDGSGQDNNGSESN